LGNARNYTSICRRCCIVQRTGSRWTKPQKKTKNKGKSQGWSLVVRKKARGVWALRRRSVRRGKEQVFAKAWERGRNEENHVVYWREKRRGDSPWRGDYAGGRGTESEMVGRRGNRERQRNSTTQCGGFGSARLKQPYECRLKNGSC